MEFAYYVAVGILNICGIVFSISGIVTLRTFNLIKHIQLSKINNLKKGIVKIKGKISTKKYLKSPFSKKNCVYYMYEIETYHTVRSGKSTSYRWKSSGYGDNRIPFTCKDTTGSVSIDPKGADFYPALKNQFYHKGSQIKRFSNALKMFKTGFQTGNMNTLDTSGWNLKTIDPKKKKIWNFAKAGDMRFNESYIEPKEQVFIIGTAKKDLKGRDIISKPGKLIISNKTHENILKTMKRKFIIALIIGPLMIAGGIVFLLTVMMN